MLHSLLLSAQFRYGLSKPRHQILPRHWHKQILRHTRAHNHALCLVASAQERMVLA